MMRQWAGMLIIAGAAGGCSALLPDSQRVVESPWKTYAAAEAMYSHIVAGGTTLAELTAAGVDPSQTPNVQVLGYVDLLRLLQPTIQAEGQALDPAIAACVRARHACFAYRIEQQSVQRERSGPFWPDFLNFRRTTEVSGWQFDALLVISGGKVVYKTWSGKPNIRETELEHHPLGPLQGLGSSLR